MKRLLILLACLAMALTAVPFATNAEDGEDISCSGVNKIEVNDPAELKGAPNDIKRVTLEVLRSRGAEGKQVRTVRIRFNVHSMYEEKDGFVLIVFFIFNTVTGDGQSPIFGMGGRMGTGSGNADWYLEDNEMISGIETENKVKLICTRIKFQLILFNPDTKEEKLCDETEWSEYVDFADTTQPQNPENFKVENEIGCARLTWKKPVVMASSTEAVGYRVYKDGSLLGSVPGNTLTFKDCDIEAGKTYKYSVCGISAWNVESPKSPFSFTYVPYAKIIPDREDVSFGQIDIDRLKSQKIRLTNYGDLDADVKFELSEDWFKVTPELLKIDKTKRTDIEVAIIPEKVKPNTSYEGMIKITWGTSDFQTISVSAYIKPDITPPEFTVDPFSEVTNQLQYTVTGTVEPGASVIINNVNAVVDGDKFKATINILPAPNTTNVEVKATDKNGNTLKKNIGKIINILNSKVVLVIGSEKMIVNDKEVAIKPAPTIVGGKTLVPLRSVADAFGASVGWDNLTKTATIIFKDKTILITLDKETALINGEPKPIGSKAIVIAGKTMVPFRFIAEALGAKVDYNGETKTITLTLEIRP